MSNLLSVSARVVIITTLNRVEIQISDLLSNPITDAQTISAIDWLLHNVDNSSIAQPVAGLSKVTLLKTGETNLGNVANFADCAAGSCGNVPTITPLASSTIVSDWSVYTNYVGASSVTAGAQIVGGTQITAMNGGTPSQLILGPGPYTSANNSITGGRLSQLKHNPFLQTDLNYHISYIIDYGTNSGVTALTQITQARMSFGTTFAANQELDLIVETPEPATTAMMLGGLGLIVIGTRRRRNPKA
ncbi:MAG: PEP-CTERM sorting domain-containing protein [Candidatus Solibacter sp.]